MKIRILGWKYENIRRMDDLEVSLEKEDGEVFSNSLLMMPNGTGKTTTLYLIRAILSGNAVKWKEREVRSYCPREASDTEGTFTLKVPFDEDIYYYILHLDYVQGKAWYETSRVDLSGGLEVGRELPYSLRGILDTEGFVNRFVFDGEQAKKTLNVGSSEAENAILYLYQLNKLDELKAKIQKLAQDRQEKSSGGATNRSVKIYKTKEERKYQILEVLKAKRDQLKQEKEQLLNETTQCESRYQEIISQDKHLQEEQNKLLRERESTERDLNETTSNLLQLMRKPYNLQTGLHVRMRGLADNMQVLKLPKTTAKEFFKELANSKECICGRCIGEKEHNVILKKMEEYLGQDTLTAVNSIKGALHDYVKDNTVPERLDQLRINIRKEHQIVNEMERLDREMAEKGNKEVLTLKQKMENLKEKTARCNHELNRLTSRDYASVTGLNPENNIPKAQKAWEEARENYERASGAYEFTQKARKLESYVEKVKQNALSRLKKYMVDEVNKKISRLVTNDVIWIKKIDGHLILDGKDGISEGQTLAVAYAYIGTLFEHSRFQFPFIVDSPAAPMDLEVRREVAGVLPQLFAQLVIFVTSGEKKGFADVFYQRKDVQYLTICGEKDKPAKCVNGREWFEKYQEKGEK